MRRLRPFPRLVRSTVPALALLLLATAVASGSPTVVHGADASPAARPVHAPIPSPVFTHQSRVQLITGDTVRVLARADGTTVSTILPGSPHAGGPLARWQTSTGSYLLPRTTAAERRRLDLSLFDVDALAAVPGSRTPVVVTFAPHASPHLVPGLHLSPSRSRSRVIRGSYGAGFRGLTDQDLAGITSIRLAASRPTQARSATTHHVVVRVLDARGHLAPGVVVTVFDVDDATAYQDDTGAGGRAAFDLPEGHYSAIGFTFSRLVIAPELDVTANQTLDLDLGAATVKPQVSLPGYHVLDAVLSVDRAAESGFAFPFTFSGSHFYMKVQPTSPDVAHGALGTGVSATLAPRGLGRRAVLDKVAVTADISRGVPDTLTYVHHGNDFARVVDRQYANGPHGVRESYVGAFGTLDNGFLDMFTGQQYLTHVPGRRVVLFQAARNASYQQTLLPQAATPESLDLTQLITTGRYLHAGTSRVETFAHGPVGPGYRGPVGRPTDIVTRDHGRLLAGIPLFDGAGSSMFSWVDGRDGEWSLRSGGKVLAHGRHDIELRAKVPSAARSYVLTATSEPVSDLWTLSTRVQDVWTFRSGGDDPSVPLLTPRYVPPVSMSGTLRPGRTTFRLALQSLTRRPHRITSARLQLSTDDGRSWRDARLVRTSPTTFRVVYRNPSARAGARFVSMRVLASDATGDSVTETATRVYRLR